ncbi:hypothetical protein [Maricaulis sp.]|uniref:hypothetical protein n=1 Tax=Maricaulis sp. TaxID=1486257 RepID=UPI00261B9E2E|nr:hypothetical protein [Maricaulis sp.]
MSRSLPQAAVIAVATSVMLAGCGATVHERHYFASYSEESPGEPTNFFRLEVSGTAALSSARYVAGYYDERAVDLIFNELRTTENQRTPALFTNLPKVEGETIRPLSPDADNGAFVMIMSTDAESVANMIGGFAERQAVAEAITNLVNRDQLREQAQSNAMSGVRTARAQAMTTALAADLEAARGIDDATQKEAAYLRALNTLARAMGRSEGFSDFAEARGWFDAHQGDSQ